MPSKMFAIGKNKEEVSYCKQYAQENTPPDNKCFCLFQSHRRTSLGFVLKGISFFSEPQNTITKVVYVNFINEESGELCSQVHLRSDIRIKVRFTG